MNLSPDGTSQQIQRRLYVNFKSNFDNSSPVLLPIFVLIYGIKDEAKSDLDMTIYDYEKAYEVVNNVFQMHIPMNMNNNKVLGLSSSISDKILPSYMWGDTSTSDRKCDFLIESWVDIHVIVQKIFLMSVVVVHSEDRNFNMPHYLNINSNVYTLDFSASKTNSVNINRLFENITKINITFGDLFEKDFIWIIKYKTFYN